MLTSIACMISGWFLNACAWTTKLGPSVSTLSLLCGVGLFIGGVIFLVVTLSSKRR